MADDLGEDEWWLSGKNAEVVDSRNDENDDHSKTKKRKHAIESDEPRKKKKNNCEAQLNTACKKKSKKITKLHAEDSDKEEISKKKKKKEKTHKLEKENDNSAGNFELSQNGTKKKKKKKEACNGNEGQGLTEVNPLSGDAEASTKKKKKKRRRLTEELSKKPDIALVPYDLTSSIAKYYTGNLSTVEMDELQLEDKHFAQCNDLTHTPQSYIKSLLPRWKKLISDPAAIHQGAPFIVIVCASGIRAVDMIRSLADFKVKDFFIAKLFSKHIKLEDQVKFLKSHRTHICVGTPKRIEELILNGSLSLEQIKFVVLDWSWRDAKLSRLLDKSQLRDHVMSLLKSCIIPRVRRTDSTVKLALL